MKKSKLLLELFLIAFMCLSLNLNVKAEASTNAQMISEAQSLIDEISAESKDEELRAWALNVSVFNEKYNTSYYVELKGLLAQFDTEVYLNGYDDKVIAYLEAIIEEAKGVTVELETLIQQGLTFNNYVSYNSTEFLWTLNVRKYNESNTTNKYYDEIKKRCDEILSDIQIYPSDEHIITAYLQFIYEEINEIDVPDLQQLKEEFSKLPADAAAADIIWLNHVQAYNEQNKDGIYYEAIAQRTNALVNANNGDSIVENWIYAYLLVGEEVKENKPIMDLNKLINEGAGFSYYDYNSVNMIMWILHVELYNEANRGNTYYDEIKALCYNMLESYWYIDIPDRNKVIAYMKAYQEILDETPQLTLNDVIQEGGLIARDYKNSSNMKFNIRVYLWMIHVNELNKKFSDDEQYSIINYKTYSQLKAGSASFSLSDISYLNSELGTLELGEPVSSTLLSLSIQCIPDKYFYLPGEAFDMTGAIINALYLCVYKDGSSAQVGKIVEDYFYEKKPVQLGETSREIYYAHHGVVKSIPVEIKVTNAPEKVTDDKQDNNLTEELKVNDVKSLKINKRKKKFIISWKKVSDITGYQYQFGMKKNFKGTRTHQTKKIKIAKKNIKKNKKYYIRVRSYKTVKLNNGQSYTIWGKWKKMVIKT